jgi:predicted XRE-type DNA-binding protein
MKDFKGFVYYNNISQKDVIEYLGVSKGYMSLVVSGKKQL